MRSSPGAVLGFLIIIGWLVWNFPVVTLGVIVIVGLWLWNLHASFPARREESLRRFREEQKRRTGRDPLA